MWKAIQEKKATNISTTLTSPPKFGIPLFRLAVTQTLNKSEAPRSTPTALDSQTLPAVALDEQALEGTMASLC